MEMKVVEQQSREKFDHDSNNKYQVQAKTQERIDTFSAQDVRVQQLKSWAAGQQKYLNEQRRKRTESDYSMQVKKRLSTEPVDFSLRPAPWGGYCRSVYDCDCLRLAPAIYPPPCEDRCARPTFIE